jgi:aminoglycoside 2'-N-acetyltransferase I
VAGVRRLASDELSSAEAAVLRELFRAAWEANSEEFTDEDWDHAVGGLHFLLEEGGAIVAHASVVERELDTSAQRLATGYVESVATSPIHQRRGYGSVLMREVDEYIDQNCVGAVRRADRDRPGPTGCGCGWRPAPSPS